MNFADDFKLDFYACLVGRAVTEVPLWRSAIQIRPWLLACHPLHRVLFSAMPC